jgi:hypothetical protein
MPDYRSFGLTPFALGLTFHITAIGSCLYYPNGFEMDKELLFDNRLINRWIAKKAVTSTEYAAYLEKLPDCADEAENIESSAVDHGDKADTR